MLFFVSFSKKTKLSSKQIISKNCRHKMQKILQEFYCYLGDKINFSNLIVFFANGFASIFVCLHRLLKYREKERVNAQEQTLIKPSVKLNVPTYVLQLQLAICNL